MRSWIPPDIWPAAPAAARQSACSSTQENTERLVSTDGDLVSVNVTDHEIGRTDVVSHGVVCSRGEGVHDADQREVRIDDQAIVDHKIVMKASEAITPTQATEDERLRQRRSRAIASDGRKGQIGPAAASLPTKLQSLR